MNILKQIIRDKKIEIQSSKKKVPTTVLKRTAFALPAKKFTFSKAIYAKNKMNVIAEIKKKSPSKGLISKNFNPVKIAGDYEKGGASAISVLTDKKYFGGELSFIQQIKRKVRLPVLRKDFIVDEYQIYESRLLNADAILLIAACLSKKQMASFFGIASKLGLDVLFEVHNAAELKKILPLKPKIIGVNNRNLKTFNVDLKVSEALAPSIPPKTIFVTESGIYTQEDLHRLKSVGADAALVGESLMKEKKPGKALSRLLGKPR